MGTMSADQIELNVLCKLWNVYIAFKYWIFAFSYVLSPGLSKNLIRILTFLDPPEVSAAERAVYPGLRGKADLTCIVKAEPRANVSINKCFCLKWILECKLSWIE